MIILAIMDLVEEHKEKVEGWKEEFIVARWDNITSIYMYHLHDYNVDTFRPNFLWHCDGYDKLKPFGIAIHGCIDGYSFI